MSACSYTSAGCLDGEATMRDEWREDDLCRRHGVTLYFRRMLTATKRAKAAKAVGITGPGLTCDCRPAVFEADLDHLRSLMCVLCNEAALVIDMERRRWRDGERNAMLDAILIVSSADLRGVDRLRYLRGETRAA